MMTKNVLMRRMLLLAGGEDIRAYAMDVTSRESVFAADESGFITGVDIPVEGGRILGPHNCDM